MPNPVWAWEEIVNIPNMLSLLRIAMVPVFVRVFFSDMPNAHAYAGIVFVSAFATAILDGYIARKYNMITRLGRVLDPLADKLITAAALVCISVADIVPWWVAGIFILKEAMMGIGTLLMYKRIDDVLPSNYFGKASTVLFFAVCLALMLFDIPRAYAVVAITAALALTIVALVVYAVKFKKIVNKY